MGVIVGVGVGVGDSGGLGVAVGVGVIVAGGVGVVSGGPPAQAVFPRFIFCLLRFAFFSSFFWKRLCIKL